VNGYVCGKHLLRTKATKDKKMAKKEGGEKRDGGMLLLERGVRSDLMK